MNVACCRHTTHVILKDSKLRQVSLMHVALRDLKWLYNKTMVTLGSALDLLTNFGTNVTKALAHLVRRPEAIPTSAEEHFYCE